MANNLKQNTVTIARVVVLPDELNAMAAQAQLEGFGFLGRLVSEFDSGFNTFSKPGEALFEARNNGALVGIGGLNRDPYVEKVGGLGVGRIRRLYVDPCARRQGVARQIMVAIEQAAQGCFAVLRLRTDTERGAMFYSQLGYKAIANDENASHVKQIVGG